MTVSSPLFTPLDEPIHGRKRLRLEDLLDFQDVTLSLTAPSFARTESTYDMFSLAVAVQLASVSKETVTKKRTEDPKTPEPEEEEPPPAEVDARKGLGTCLRVFCDHNDNGIFDDGDQPFEGVPVKALNQQPSALNRPDDQTESTDANGLVCFTDEDDSKLPLPPGRWKLVASPPTGGWPQGCEPKGALSVLVEVPERPDPPPEEPIDQSTEDTILFVPSPEDPADPDPPATTRSRSEDKTVTSPTQVSAAEIEALRAKTGDFDANDDVTKALVSLLTREPDNFALPPDTLATLIASIDTYMTNLEEFYNVDGFDYRNGLSSRYVPYKAHFQVTAEPGWFSRYRNYDAVVDVRLSIRRNKDGGLECVTTPKMTPDEVDQVKKKVDERKKEGECDEIIILHVSPLETAQTINEFAAAMTEFAVAAQVAGSASTEVSFGARADRLNAAAERLQGTRAHKTLTVGFPDSNRMRIRFMADRVGTDAGRDLQPVSRILTATVLVPVEFVHGLDARALGQESRDYAEAYRKLVRSSRTKDAARDDVRQSLGVMLDQIRTDIAASQRRDGREVDPFVQAVMEQAAAAIQAGERIKNVLTPLITLLRDQVPVKFEIEAQSLIRETREKLKAEPTTSWNQLFAKFSREPVEKIVAAFEEASDPERVEIKTKTLAGEILKVGKEKFFEDTRFFKEMDGVLKESAHKYNKDKVGPEARRAWISAKAIKVLFRMFLMERAFDGMDGRLDKRLKDHNGDLDHQRKCVRRLLCGARCDIKVDAYFAPTMFGPSGDPQPPRNFVFNIDPPDARVRAYTDKSARVAPIPPWMGPLDDELTILSVEGVYGKVTGDAISIARELAAAQKDVKAAKSKFDKAKAAKEAQENDFGFKQKKKQKKEQSKSAQKLIKDLAPQRREVTDALAEVRKKKREKASEEEIQQAEAHVKSAKEDLRTKAIAEDESLARKPGDVLLQLETRVSEWFALLRQEGEVYRQFEAASEALAESNNKLADVKLRAALAKDGGRATVRVEYSAPTLILDSHEELVHTTEVYARVVGVGAVSCRATSGSCESTDEGMCAPGAFCRVLPGVNHTVIEVQGLDLSLVGRETRAIRGYLQLVAVPVGVEPNVAWMRTAAQVATAEVLLRPQVRPVDTNDDANGETR